MALVAVDGTMEGAWQPPAFPPASSSIFVLPLASYSRKKSAMVAIKNAIKAFPLWCHGIGGVLAVLGLGFDLQPGTVG